MKIQIVEFPTYKLLFNIMAPTRNEDLKSPFFASGEACYVILEKLRKKITKMIDIIILKIYNWVY